MRSVQGENGMDEKIISMLANKAYMIQLETDNATLCESLKDTLLEFIKEDEVKEFTKEIINYNFLLGFRAACVCFANEMTPMMSEEKMHKMIDVITNKAAIIEEQ